MVLKPQRLRSKSRSNKKIEIIKSISGKTKEFIKIRENENLLVVRDRNKPTTEGKINYFR